jgi:hypothetical protein
LVASRKFALGHGDERYSWVDLAAKRWNQPLDMEL